MLINQFLLIINLTDLARQMDFEGKRAFPAGL